MLNIKFEKGENSNAAVLEKKTADVKKQITKIQSFTS